MNAGSFSFLRRARSPIDECPILRVLREGWDAQAHPSTFHSRPSGRDDKEWGVTASEFATGRRLQIPPLRSFGAPVGMTRIVQLLSGRVASWTDGVKSGYSAKTADPSTALLRSSGRDDKDSALLSGRVASWTDEVKSGYSAKTADPSTALLRSSGRDDKDSAITFRKSCELDGRS
jgi:hypothetical protein